MMPRVNDVSPYPLLLKEHNGINRELQKVHQTIVFASS